MIFYPFRVFISYAHEDRELVTQIDDILGKQGLRPTWDKQLELGFAFTDEIKRLLASSHVVMPLITKQSKNRPWVNQEIGFAMGLGIPVLAIALDDLPAGMIAGIHALDLRDGGMTKLLQRLTDLRLDKLVMQANQVPDLKTMICSNQMAAFPEERTRLLVEYARTITPPAKVRCRGIFSSFSLPAGGTRDPAWELLEYEQPRSYDYRRLLCDEHNVLATHAKTAGCSLILHPITEGRHVRGRITELLKSLGSMNRQETKVAISKHPMERQLTIVGDSLAAIALPPRSSGMDYEQTFFTSHPPTVFHHLQQFDEELDTLLSQEGTQPDQSLHRAIEYFRSLI